MSKDKNKSTKINTTEQKKLQDFIDELKKLAEAYDEFEFNDILVEEIAPMLTEEDQLFTTSVFSKLDLAVELSQSEIDNRHRSIKNAMRVMNEDAICWLLDHVYALDYTIQVLNTEAKERSILEETLRDRASSLKRDRDELQKWLNSDLFDRIQIYRNEIKELREA